MTTLPPKPPGEPNLRPRGRSLLRSARQLPAIGLAGSILPLALLSILAETRPGRWLGLLSVVLLAGLAAGFSPWRDSWRLWAGLAGLTVAAALGLAAAARVRPAVPDSVHRGLLAFEAGRPGPVWARSYGVLPEIDLVKLGAQVVSRVVPWVRPDHCRRIREVTLAHYREVEADPNGRALAPVYHLALAELLGLDFDTGHYYVYLPRAEPGEALGAVVFLHGNAGNFKVLPWAWRRLAEEKRLAIVCPTFGYGLWDEGGVEAVERVRSDAVARLGLDAGRIYLAGLSDGGKGVTRTATAHPDAYRGLIYLSPTMLLDELADPRFVAAWAGRPVLVATGGLDWNVRPETVAPAVDRLRDAGCLVESLFDPEEDHFYFFGRLDFLLDRIGGWMDRPAGRAGPVERGFPDA